MSVKPQYIMQLVLTVKFFCFLLFKLSGQCKSDILDLLGYFSL